MNRDSSVHVHQGDSVGTERWHHPGLEVVLIISGDGAGLGRTVAGTSSFKRSPQRGLLRNSDGSPNYESSGVPFYGIVASTAFFLALAP